MRKLEALGLVAAARLAYQPATEGGHLTGIYRQRAALASVLASGIHPILGKKARNYEHRRLQERIPPPPSHGLSVKKPLTTRRDDRSASPPVAVDPRLQPKDCVSAAMRTQKLSQQGAGARARATAGLVRPIGEAIAGANPRLLDNFGRLSS